MNFSTFEVVTFDCYGTLIDWETGILRAIRAAFPRVEATDHTILRIYSEVEPAIQQGSYKSYRTILREVLAEFAERWQQPPEQRDSLADSLGNWKPFPDTVPALRRLRERFKLGIISNIDNDLFALSSAHLKVSFDHVITAEQVRSYKPALRNFHAALEQIKLPASRVLHVAESRFHDIVPARTLGFTTVWVNRHSNERAGASRQVDAEPWLIVRNLTELADVVEKSH